MRRPVLATATLCALLIVMGAVASRRSGKMDFITERDGSRTVHRRVFGFYPTSHSEPDPSLHVSEDFRKELKRLGIKLTPALDRLAFKAGRHSGGSHVRYAFSGEVPTKTKDVVDALAHQFPRPQRWTTAKDDQFSSTCADGRSRIEAMVDTRSGTTWVDFVLIVRR